MEIRGPTKASPVTYCRRYGREIRWVRALGRTLGTSPSCLHHLQNDVHCFACSVIGKEQHHSFIGGTRRRQFLDWSPTLSTL